MIKVPNARPVIGVSARSQVSRAQVYRAAPRVEVVNRTGERTTYRFRIYVRTPGVPEAESKLELVPDQPLSWLEFSPDGRRVAPVLSGASRIVPVGN